MGDADFLSAATARAEFGPETTNGAPDDTLVMLRPDDVTFVVDDAGTAIIRHAEFRGSTWNYSLRLSSGSDVHSIRSHLVHVPVGTHVTAMINPGHHPVQIPRADTLDGPSAGSVPAADRG
jgi:hypothetical protein